MSCASALSSSAHTAPYVVVFGRDAITVHIVDVDIGPTTDQSIHNVHRAFVYTALPTHSVHIPYVQVCRYGMFLV